MQKKITIPLLVIALCSVIFLLFYIGYYTTTCSWDNWTGFGSYTKPHKDYVRGKTLWDWLQLLIIPLILTGGIWWLNKRQEQSKIDLNLKQEESKQKLESNNRKQNTLENYFDKMSELILKDGSLKNNENAQTIARARTLLVMRELDGNRKAQALQFLRDSKLIRKPPTIDLQFVVLDGVNFERARLDDCQIKNAYFKKATFHEASLEDSNVEGCDFTDSKFTKAVLKNTIFNNAILKGAVFDGADLKGAKFEDAQQIEKADFSKAKNIPSELAAKLNNTSDKEEGK